MGGVRYIVVRGEHVCAEDVLAGVELAQQRAIEGRATTRDQMLLDAIEEAAHVGASVACPWCATRHPARRDVCEACDGTGVIEPPRYFATVEADNDDIAF